MPGCTLRASSVARVLRQRHTWSSFLRRLKTQEKRDDRMTVGSDGKLALPSLGQTAVSGHNGADLVRNEHQQLTALPLGECTSLGCQCSGNGVGPPHRLTKPGQVV